MQMSEKAEDFVEKLTNALYKRELRRGKWYEKSPKKVYKFLILFFQHFKRED